MAWQQQVIDVFRANDVRFIVHVPDLVLADLIRQLSSDEEFQVVGAAREEEGVGIVCGALLGGQRGALLMQNSGLGNAANALASLAVPYQLPFVIFISQRGELGEFNPAQVPMSLAVRPTLEALGIPFFTIQREDELEKILQGAIKLAFSTDRPVALILSTLLTGGKAA